MNKTVGDIHIAGSLTTDDWKHFRATLIPGGDQVTWGKAFHDYFRQRLSLRYLDPIQILQGSGTYRGEGFSIVTIQCSLIEFLESTVQGKSYKYCPRGATPGPFEYSRSGEIFVSFLMSRTPFKNDFRDKATAEDFYEGVRCGLLHEARTKNGWTILAKHSGNQTVDVNQKIIFRNNFQTGLLAFVEWL